VLSRFPPPHYFGPLSAVCPKHALSIVSSPLSGRRTPLIAAIFRLNVQFLVAEVAQGHAPFFFFQSSSFLSVYPLLVGFLTPPPFPRVLFVQSFCLVFPDLVPKQISSHYVESFRPVRFFYIILFRSDKERQPVFIFFGGHKFSSPLRAVFEMRFLYRHGRFQHNQQETLNQVLGLNSPAPIFPPPLLRGKVPPTLTCTHPLFFFTSLSQSSPQNLANTSAQISISPLSGPSDGAHLGAAYD